MPDPYGIKVLRESRKLCESFKELYDEKGSEEALDYVKSELSGKRRRFQRLVYKMLCNRYPELNINYD